MRTLALHALMLAGVLLAGGCRTPVRPPAGVEPVVREMTVTAYCPCGACCGWHRTWYGRPVYSSRSLRGLPKIVGQTASGVMARRGTLAADTARYPFGTVMHVPGYGYGRVEDRGDRIRGERLDVFFPAHRKALEWGVRRVRVTIWVPPPAAP